MNAVVYYNREGDKQVTIIKGNMPESNLEELLKDIGCELIELLPVYPPSEVLTDDEFVAALE